MRKAELIFYRLVCIAIGWIVGIPLFLNGLLFLMNCLYWLGHNHWVHITPCGASYFGKSIPFEAFEALKAVRCYVTPMRQHGLDLILDYFINELSVFISGAIIAVLGLGIVKWLGDKAGRIEWELDEADRIKRGAGKRVIPTEGRNGRSYVFSVTLASIGQFPMI